MTRLDAADREIRSHNRTVTRPREGGASPAPTTGALIPRDMLWITAALVESLTLVGGLYWILSGPGGMALPWRIALVALLAVLGGAGFVYAASLSFRSRD